MEDPALRLDRDETTVAAIRDAVRSLLDNPAHRQAAERVQAEIRAMPTAEHTITKIDALIASRHMPPAG
jgi:UDP:flavonoid glycosyltransferase YjiC (YdhE family)